MKRVLCVLLSLSLTFVLAADSGFEDAVHLAEMAAIFQGWVNGPRALAAARFAEDIDMRSNRELIIKEARAYVEDFSSSYLTVDSETLTTAFSLPYLSSAEYSFDDFQAHAYFYMIFTVNKDGDYVGYTQFSKDEDGTNRFSSPYSDAEGLIEILQETGFENTIFLKDWGHWYIWVKEENGMEYIRPIPTFGVMRGPGEPMDVQTFLDAVVYRNETYVPDGRMGDTTNIRNYLGKKPGSLKRGNTAFLIGTGIIFAVGTGIAVLLFVKRRKRRRQRNLQVK